MTLMEQQKPSEPQKSLVQEVTAWKVTSGRQTTTKEGGTVKTGFICQADHSQ